MAGIETAVEAARRYIIKRPRLTRLLDKANSRVLMLIAPAGFGKTTLAREWAGERKHVWYQGTTATADVAALAAGLSEVVSELIPEAGSRMVHRMRATGTPEEDVDVLAELFAEDLAEWPEDAWLVFDDYQFAMDAVASERFMEVILRDAPVRLLLTSRKRPSWASARRLLYGEVYELGRNDLAMNQDEASNVLSHRSGAPAAGLVALAEGWPAVIGLAALAEDFELPDGTLPDTLYEYFAEELYQAASPEVQRGLCLLTLAPSLTESVAECLLGPDAPAVIAEGIRLGFLTGNADADLDLHPLLRTFLDRRADVAALEAHTATLLLFLTSEGLWNDCISLLEKWFAPALLVEFFEAFLPFALREARFQGIQRCLDLASVHGLDSPLIDLADAELLYRGGHWSRAEHAALYAAERLGEKHSLCAKALRLAGASAHMLLDVERSFRHFGRSREVAGSAKDAVEALFGQVMCSVNDERPETQALLNELASIDEMSPEAQLKVLHAQNFVATLSNVRESPARSELGGRLLSRIAEPLARTGYLNSWANALLVGAQYEHAETVASRLLREANDFRLRFVLPHAYLDLAGAWWGLGHYAKASHYVERAVAAAPAEDRFSIVNAATLQTKILLALGAIEEAAETAARHGRVTALRSIEAELVATRALALVTCGRHRDGLALCDAAERMSQRVEVRGIVPLVRSVVALQEGPDDVGAAAEALLQADRLGNYDAVVLAFRACPPLLRSWASKEELHLIVSRVVDAAGAQSLAARAGAQIHRARSREAKLSPREEEVGGLVAQGFTNQQIADTLFISVATVKVHLNHIFEKLGVRTRTEAALRLSAADDSVKRQQ